MAKTKVLICVKTYPTLSEKYDELVCTAGVKEDGSWIRIYPVPFRKLNYDKQYSKWQWIELDLIRNSKDLRPESYRPNLESPISLLEKVGTEHSWAERKRLVLQDVKTNMSELIGIRRTLMIEDWEIGMLYLNSLKAAKGDESVACQKVREKYFNEFTNDKDLYFFLGTTLKFHNIAPNPFIIIGTFYPPKPKDEEPTLF